MRLSEIFTRISKQTNPTREVQETERQTSSAERVNKQIRTLTPGKVLQGRNVGRKLGFPTANILPLPGFALPSFGVYATTTNIKNKKFRSITNIGKPLF